MAPYLGEIRAFPFAFAPKGWHLCDGSLLRIMDNMPLFNLLSNRYGGDGTQNFGLPDLRGRVLLSQGSGPEGGSYACGNAGGSQSVALTVAQLPAHNHSIACNGKAATSDQATDRRLALTPSTFPAYAEERTTIGGMSPQALAAKGGSQAHNNLQPSLVINFCIAVAGDYPPRSE